MPNDVALSTLYLVPTPIGNLQDITLRAVDVLKNVDLIACEDTRRTLTLLNSLGISKPLVSYHAHSAPAKARDLVRALHSGKKVALVCDAGTPGLSDPGTELVQAAIKEGLAVCSLPGPCAAITGLVASGLPTDRFFFIGFLPRRPARAKRRLNESAATGATVVLYESPFRTRQTVEWIRDGIGGDTPVVLARELSKLHEEFMRGTARDISDQLAARELKGEVVILFRKPEEPEPEESNG